MSFCESFIRNILYVFNFFVAITGLILVAIGTFAQVFAQNYINFMGKQYSYIPILIIAVGVVIFVIAFFGCCGARQKNHCMLRTYAALLILIFIVEIVAGIAVYVLKGALKDELVKNMKEGINNYNVTGFEGMTQTWDLLQHELECCGVDGKKDWQESTVGINSTVGVNSTLGKIPVSCCPGGKMECDDSSKFEKGCLSNIEHHLRINIDVVGGIAIGICVLQLFGLFFSCIIRKTGGLNSDENLSMQEI